MSFKKISGIVQIPIFIQLHYSSSGTALSQGSSEKFPIRSEKFSYSKKDVDKRCWFSVVCCCANLVEFRIKIYVLKVIGRGQFCYVSTIFKSFKKFVFIYFWIQLLLLICSKHRGASMFLNSHLKRKLYYRKRKA